MASHSSTLAWKIPWTEEPGRLQTMGSRRVGHDWATSLSLFPFMHWRRKWQPTPVFLPWESQGRGSLVAAVYGHDWSDLAVIDSRGSQHFQIWGNGGKVTNWYRLKITCLKSWGLESRIWGLWRILTPHWNLGQHSETLYFCSETC